MVKFAVLGCGRIGRMHALNLARHPRVELAYVYDVAPATAAAVADATGARQARTVEEILAADVPAVVAATSRGTKSTNAEAKFRHDCTSASAIS